MASIISSKKNAQFSEIDIERCRKFNEWILVGNDPVALGIRKSIEKLGFDLDQVTISWILDHDVDEEFVAFITRNNDKMFSFVYSYRGLNPDCGEIFCFTESQLNENNISIRAALQVRDEIKT